MQIDSARAICPNCGSDAVYRYGRLPSGKQRYLCILCARQFIIGGKNTYHRPACSACGSKMHCYRKEGGYIRFRCSQYPECKTYAKVRVAETSKRTRNISIISDQYDFICFLNTVKEKKRNEVILLASQEATTAERRYIKSRMQEKAAATYAGQLKKLATCLKCKTTPKYFAEDINEIIFRIKKEPAS